MKNTFYLSLTFKKYTNACSLAYKCWCLKDFSSLLYSHDPCTLRSWLFATHQQRSSQNSLPGICRPPIPSSQHSVMGSLDFRKNCRNVTNVKSSVKPPHFPGSHCLQVLQKQQFSSSIPSPQNILPLPSCPTALKTNMQFDILVHFLFVKALKFLDTDPLYPKMEKKNIFFF